MRMLITGGFGFVGGRLGKYLCQNGHQVVLGSRAKSFTPGWLPLAEVVQIDWDNYQSLQQICIGVDVLIHAAGMNAQDCEADPVTALEFNGLATARLIEAASAAGVKRFIYLSTAHVYANPLVGIIHEDSCPRNLHPYATSHLSGEAVVLGASQRKKIEGIVLRLSNAFGAPMHKHVNCWTLLLNDLCRQAVQSRQLVLHSNGLQQRDFIAMAEVCRAIDFFASIDSNALTSYIFNVGGVSRSVLEMAQLVQERCNILFGFEPKLQRRSVSVADIGEELIYRKDKLLEIGLEIGMDNDAEIDKLLQFCRLN